MRFVRVALLALLASALTLSARSQSMTTITATQVNAGSGLVTGTLCLHAVNASNSPISISKSGGGFYLANLPFCGTLTSGALVGSLQVPNPQTDSAPGHAYDVIVYDSVHATQTDLGPVYGIGGSTWSLDTYIPTVTMPTTQAFTFTYGSGSAPSSCVAPALDSRVNAGVATISICSGGGFVPSASSLSATIEHVFTGAGTANYTHNLGTTYPLMTCYVKSGSSSYSANPVDANNVAITAAAASDILCAFDYAPSTVSFNATVINSVSTGLVSYLPMNEGSGLVFNNAVAGAPSAQSQTGLTWSGSPLYPQFTAGTASGADGFFPDGSWSTLFLGNVPWSVSFWSTPASPLSNGIQDAPFLSDLNGAPGFEIVANHANNGILTAILYDGTGMIQVNSPTGVLVSGTRGNYIVTYDGSGHAAGVHIYVNGSLSASTVVTDTLTGSIASGYTPMLMSQPNTGSSPDHWYGAGGEMDHLRFYDRALASADIATIYAGGN